MMKRILAFALSLCILLAAVSAYADGLSASFFQQMNDDSTVEEDQARTDINSACAIGDTLYILTSNAIFRWTLTDDEPTLLLRQDGLGSDYDDTVADDTLAIGRLFADGQTLYGLNRANGVVFKLADENGFIEKPTVAVKLDWANARKKQDDYSYTLNMGDALVQDGTLYVLFVDYENNTVNYLISWSLADGKQTDKKDGVLLKSLTPYKDGLFLCKYYDENDSWDAETQTAKPASFATYNPANGETNVLLTLDISSFYGVRYNAAKDVVYYTNDSRVYSLSGMQLPAKVSAYLPQQSWDDASYGILGDNCYFEGDYSGMNVRELDLPELANGALTIYGEWGSVGHQAYLKAYPEALVTCTSDYYDSLESFTNEMVSGSDAIDVLRLSSNSTPLTRLIDKGYALDLSGYSEITDLTAEMDQNLLSCCMKDGKLYAVPVDIDANTFSYSEEAWKELGLTEDDVPKTFMELLDFVENWQYDYADEHANLKLFDDSGIHMMLLNYLMKNYYAYSLKNDGKVTYDTELFRKLLTKLDGIDFSELDVDLDGTDMATQDEFWNKTAVFNSYGSLGYPSNYRYQKMMILPLDEGLEPAISCSVTTLMVNTRTPRAEQAVQYLATYVMNLESANANITIFQNHNDAIPNKDFEKQVADWQTYLDQRKAELETAEPADQAGIKSDIEYFEDLIANSDEYRFDVSAEEIQMYREQIAPYLVVTGQTPLDTWDKDGSNDFYTQMQQYVQGAITADQFVKEVDKRMRMMQLEDQ